MIRVDAMDSLYRFILFLRSTELVVNKDPADDENVAVQLDFAHCFRSQFAVRGVNLTRFQRASEGSCESARRGRDHVIKCGCVGSIGVRRDLVMRRNL